MNKNILIVCYGGTIVMYLDRNRQSIVEFDNNDDIKQVINQIPTLSEKANIDIVFKEKKDSTNVSPEDWTELAAYIYDVHSNNHFDGIVITHGTNTMSYTASALSLALGNGLKIPIVITGSQLPLEQYGTDARFNFENAILTASEAATRKYTEVMICFSDMILRGNRTVKVSESDFRAFRSPAYPELGWIRSTGIIWNQAMLENYKNRNHRNEFKLSNTFCKNILSIDLIPGQNPNILNKLISSNDCKAVILKSHGAGSVPTYTFNDVADGEYRSYLEFIRGTVDKKVPVVVATKFLGGNSYKEVNDECAVRAIEAGAISAKDLTDVMTEVKLMWIIGRGFREISDIETELHNNYVGEIG